MGSLQIKREMRAQGECLVATNGTLEMTVLVSGGPRILGFGFVGQENEFCDSDPFEVPFEKETWRIVGGHRLWHSPEVIKRTYYPDNAPVSWRVEGDALLLDQKLEPWVQIKKDIRVTFLPEGNCVRVEHFLKNCNAWPIRLAAWSLSEMAHGGVGVMPFSEPEADPMCGSSGLRSVTLWTYARMTDPRVTWLDNCCVLRQEHGNPAEFKMGANSDRGWMGYFNHGHLFIKRFSFVKGAEYPDNGCSCEAYIDANMLEMETLSPMTSLAPDEAVTHTEEWALYDGVPAMPAEPTQMPAHIANYCK